VGSLAWRVETARQTGVLEIRNTKASNGVPSTHERDYE